MEEIGPSPEQWRKIAIKLAEENGGKLPTFATFERMGMKVPLSDHYRIAKFLDGIEREKGRDLSTVEAE